MAPRKVPFGPFDSTGPSRYTFWVMALMFFLSGAAALMYQIIWAKQLALVFGVTLYATSAVVTTFMAGLALGSLYFGRLVDRWERPLVLFAILEGCIGAFALVFPAIIEVLTRIYVVFYGPFGDNHYVMSLLRFAMAFLVLIVPTSLMGGTLPVITRAYVLGHNKLGRDIASLYSANNIGAFVGCVSGGYIFLELFGPTGDLRLAGLINMVVMAMSLCISRQWKAGPAEVQSRSDQLTSGAQSGGLSRPVKVALWVFALEGVAFLVYQMAWMRELIFFVNSDIFGVTAIVATFLLSLSVGAFVCRRWVDRLKNLYKTLGIIELGIAVTALATIPIMSYLLGAKNAVLANILSRGFPLSVGITAANFAVTLIVILPSVAPFSGEALRMSDVTGALALAQIRKLDGIVEHFGNLAKSIRSQIGQSVTWEPRLQADPAGDTDLVMGWFGQDAEHAKQIQEALEAEGIACGRQPYGGPLYSVETQVTTQRRSFDLECPELVYKAGLCPNSESILARYIFISLGIMMDQQEADDTAKALVKVGTHLRTKRS